MTVIGGMLTQAQFPVATPPAAPGTGFDRWLSGDDDNPYFQQSDGTVKQLPYAGIAVEFVSVSVTGTGGAGYYGALAQSAAPSAPAATGWSVYADASGNFAWRTKNGSDTYSRIFAATLSGDRTYTLPDYSATLATLTGVETLTNKTLTTPTIGSFTNAQHSHTDAAGGGTLNASAIAAGALMLARGGTHADLSATGGTGQFLRQDTAGADITVGVIVSADINSALTTPGAIGGGTPAAGTFTTLTANLSASIPKLSNLTTNGFVKTSGSDGTLSIDTSTYLTGNQTITLSGDVTGSGATAITTTLATVNANVGSFAIATLTVNAKGLITAASAAATTGSGSVVLASSPTIVTPTIASFTNATHTHQNAAGGGTLDAAAIAAGTLALARGGTNADLSATGAANSFLKQSSSGAAITVGTIASADIATALTTPGAIGGGTANTGAFTRVNFTGTGGAGFANFVAQSSAPSTPSGSFTLYADASNRLAFLNTSGFAAIFDHTGLTASRTYTLPNQAGTLVLTQNPAAIFAAISGAGASLTTNGFVAQNATVAIVGAQTQNSPIVLWQGSVWDTGAASSKTMRAKSLVVAVPGNPSSAYLLTSVDGGSGSYTDVLKVLTTGIDVAGAGLTYSVNGTQVVKARITGYTAMTGTPDKATAYDTSTVTLAQLAGRVAQLQADLTTHGLIGA